MSEHEAPRKVAFMGTSCVGKTTLLEMYKKRFFGNPDVSIVPEAARKFFEDNPQSTDRFAKDAQGQVQALALRQEQEAHASGAQVIFCDRSVIDAVVYVRAHGDKKGAAELLDRVNFWLPTYHTLFLLSPADVPYEKDDVRQEDESVRQGFHDTYIDFFEESKIPYKLLSGTLEERIARVDEVIAE